MSAHRIEKRFIGLALLVMAISSACAVQVVESGEDESLGTTEEAVTASMSRGEIIALGASGVGYSYWWGHGRWDPASKSHPGKCSGSCGGCSHWASPKGGPEYGADCSGFVAQAWQVPGEGSPKVDRHPYSTYNFRYEKTHWYPIKKSELKAGDALVYNSGKKGHIVLFESWTGGGKAMAYECAGCKVGCIHKPRGFGSSYIAIRRKGVEDEAKNDPPKGQLEKASCDGGLRGWAFDPDAGKGAVDVVLTFDGPITSPKAKKLTLKADEDRTDLAKKLGSSKHGFTAPIPATLKDGKKHTLYAYAVDDQGKQTQLLTGAPRSVTCGPAPSTKADDPPHACGHSECQTGGALTKDCSPCADQVCLIKPSCCDTQKGKWDASCVDLAGETVGACRGVCAGGPSSCAHSECDAGTALSASCSECAAHVCKRDPFCCSSGKWDFICAKEAKEDPWCSCGTP